MPAEVALEIAKNLHVFKNIDKHIQGILIKAIKGSRFGKPIQEQVLHHINENIHIFNAVNDQFSKIFFCNTNQPLVSYPSRTVNFKYS